MEARILVRHVQNHELAELHALLRAKAEFDGVSSSLVADFDDLRHALFSYEAIAQALVATSDGALIGMATYYRTFSSFIAKPCLWLDLGCSGLAMKALP